jgi:hypothetical protein
MDGEWNLYNFKDIFGKKTRDMQPIQLYIQYIAYVCREHLFISHTYEVNSHDMTFTSA